MAEKYQKDNGLDMSPTIQFYERNKAKILARMPKVDYDSGSGYAIETESPSDVNEHEIASIVNSFPREFLKRSILEKIVLKPSLWFKEDPAVSSGDPTTQNHSEAVFPSAIIPGYTGYRGENTGNEGWRLDSAQIDLYKIALGEYGCDESDVRKVISLQALAHELAHTVITPELSTANHREIIMPGSDIAVPAIEEIIRYGNLTEKHEPISRYAGNYRKNFSSEDANKALTAINEDLAETIAAHLLNFSSCGNDARGLNPMADRPEVRKFVEDYLNARRAE